jgi:predicted aminopeptidase
MDTCLVAVPAYSTLGFFDDPLTDPMLRYGDGQVVETILHELVHATAFVDGDAPLSESVAQFIGEEASVRFFADVPERAARRRAEVRDDRLLATALMTLRDDVAALYAEPVMPAERARRRAALERAARAALTALPLETRDAARLAEEIRLGDACLALRGTYVADQPRHAAVLAALGGDLRALVERWVEAAASDDPRARFFSLDSLDSFDSPGGDPTVTRDAR